MSYSVFDQGCHMYLGRQCVPFQLADWCREKYGASSNPYYGRPRLAQLPRDTMMFIVGGSPCQQLTTIGVGGGHLGLAGRDSVHFFIFLALAWVIQRLRPDLLIHVVVENAGTPMDIHRRCMRRSLGVDTGNRVDPVIAASKWTVFPRRRIFLATLPWNEPAGWPAMRQAPWDQGWAPRPRAVMPTMLRSRNRGVGLLRASSYQYAPRYLLYK